MFEDGLKEKIKRIFDLDKATFNAHGDIADIHSDSKEQQCLFIKVEKSHNALHDGKFIARVEGKITVFCNAEKLPYGYFTKKIVEANPEDSKDFYFFNMEENANQFQNISERNISFIYLFESQYDPNVGTLNEVETESA